MELNTNNDLEQLWISVVVNKQKIGLGVFYRPPSSSITALNNLQGALAYICVQVEDIILVGDANID